MHLFSARRRVHSLDDITRCSLHADARIKKEFISKVFSMGRVASSRTVLVLRLAGFSDPQRLPLSLSTSSLSVLLSTSRIRVSNTSLSSLGRCS